MAINRRDFLTLSATGMAAGLAASSAFGAGPAAGSNPNLGSGADSPSAPPQTVRKGDMVYRRFGDKDELISLLGLGGHHIGRIKDDQDSIRLMRAAIDNGITFMDNCWDYHDGRSEELMGKALQDGYRDRVFLMTKFDGRDRKTAASQMEESLRRLRTDRIDLMQVHEVIRPHDPDLVFSEGGAMEALLEFQKAGKVRYIGFTGHKDPFVHRRMLEMAAERGVRFDAVQMPLNVLDAHFRSFQHEVLPLLVRNGIAPLGMKPLAQAYILKTKTASATECLHYAMSLPTSTVITGIESMEILQQALQAARSFKPMSREQLAELLSRTQQVAMSGRYEPFKTTFEFDGTAKHQEWLGNVGV
ncbi:aldo/keto reductase [Desulfocurvibacter africanus]|uniref:aldo/keto reductase n=1 Tax=Desulfocurvibacter africanus TaxID=873 RepID=UPI00040C75E9|nr:aldo/keto reductase [Desulfocurvibacter africanus]